MNCQDFEGIILALARQPLLDAAIYKQGLAHTEDCARCAARLAEERSLRAGIQAVVTEMAQAEAPAHIEVALLTAFREQAAATTAPAFISMPARNRHWSQWMLRAAAAVILVLGSVAVILWQRSSSSDQKRAAQVLLPKPAGSSAPTPKRVDAVTDSGQGTAPHPITPSRSQRRHHPRQSQSNETEIATKFFPLMDGEDLSLLESIQVVRVELPGSALRAVGLPVDAAMMSEPVKADVILGHDGRAHAIRFVR